MPPRFFRLWQKDSQQTATEHEVMSAGNEFLRKGDLVDRINFLPPEMKKAAKNAALNRFLEILARYLRS